MDLRGRMFQRLGATIRENSQLLSDKSISMYAQETSSTFTLLNRGELESLSADRNHSLKERRQASNSSPGQREG